MEQVHNFVGRGGGGTFTASEAEIGHRRVLKGMNRAMEAVNVVQVNNVHASPSKAAIYVDGREGLPSEQGA